MKLRLITTLLILCSVLMGCEKELPVYDGEVLERDGLVYKPRSNVPLTAKVEGYHKNGQLWHEDTYVDGKKEGLAKNWYDNGQLFSRSSFSYGKPVGLRERWHRNGEIYQEATFVNGEREGLEKEWSENGQLTYERKYLNGQLEGLTTIWLKIDEPYFRCYRAGKPIDMSYCEPKE